MRRYVSGLTLCLFALVACSQKKAPEIRQYTIEQFMNTKRIGGGAISHDDRLILYFSNESGIVNGYTVAAANCRFYGGGMRIAPNADPADGLLEVVLVEQSSKLRFLSNLPKVFSAKHVELEGVRTFRAREVEISADRPFDVYADGDRITELPTTVRVVPRALRVLAPVSKT